MSEPTAPHLKAAGGRQGPVVFVDPTAGVEAVVCTADDYSEPELDQGYVGGYRCDLSTHLVRRGETWVAQIIEQSFMGRSPTVRARRAFHSDDGGRTWRQVE